MLYSSMPISLKESFTNGKNKNTLPFVRYPDPCT